MSLPDLGWLWHLLAGVGFSLLVILVPYWWVPLALMAFGLGRELWQHSGEMNTHRWIEALAWPSGWAVLMLLRWLLT